MFWARKIYSKATTVTSKEPAEDAQDKLNECSIMFDHFSTSKPSTFIFGLF